MAETNADRRKATQDRRQNASDRRSGAAARVSESARHEERQGIRSFLEAWGIFAVLVLFLVLGVSVPSCIVRTRSAATETSSATTDTEQTVPALPSNIPLIAGASLSRYTVSGATSIFSYTVSQGSKAGVQTWYQTELEKRGWERQPRSNDTESEYQTSSRKLVITLNYQASHVIMQIKITKKT